MFILIVFVDRTKAGDFNGRIKKRRLHKLKSNKKKQFFQITFSQLKSFIGLKSGHFPG